MNRTTSPPLSHIDSLSVNIKTLIRTDDGKEGSRSIETKVTARAEYYLKSDRNYDDFYFAVMGEVELVC